MLKILPVESLRGHALALSYTFFILMICHSHCSKVAMYADDTSLAHSAKDELTA